MIAKVHVFFCLCKKMQYLCLVNALYLPAEWQSQCAVQLTWPHGGTDWAPILPEITATYVRLAVEIARREPLLIVCRSEADVRSSLEGYLEGCHPVTFIEIPTDDTWARDHGFITLLDAHGGGECLDFRFNGWGQKFASSLDNQICDRMRDRIAFRYRSRQNLVLEGGAIESDGHGTILTTSQCLLAPNRNQPLSRCRIERRLLNYLHARRILWLDHGYLAGDDTDSHVDTLARFCPGDTIAYVQCLDPADEHYEELGLMETQLRSFRTLDGRPYRLVPLPMAAAAFDADGGRLPATYANFLFVNGAVLLPVYGDECLDALAARQLAVACPDHEVVPVPCRTIIEQHGSLHCCTMQFPEGSLRL